MWVEPTIADIAVTVADCIGANDDPSAVRLCLRFFERYEKSDIATRRTMVEKPPAPTGSARFDALLAAVVEYSCARYRERIPAWVDEQRYFLDEFWFVSGLRSLEADAFAHSPISFARRGVFVTEGALTYA